MRNRFVALSLISVIPVGLLIATSKSNENIAGRLAFEQRDVLPNESIPTVQFATAAYRPGNEPLVSPIVPPESLAVTRTPVTFEFTPGDRAVFHPHGEQVCASGCAASRHPTGALTQERFINLMTEYANESFGTSGPAQDALLYYGRQTSQLLATEGVRQVDPVRLGVLKYQLAHDHAEIEIRVVDVLDQVRASLPPTKVPLDRRHEFELDTNQLQPMIASGTVKRVGRDFVWTRL